MNELWSIPPSDFLTLMDQKDRAALLAITEKQSFARNDFVFQAGSPGENVYILVSGRIKIFQLSPVGKEILMWFCFPGEVFGLAEVSRVGAREVYAQACSDSEVLIVPQSKFKQFLASSPATAMLVIDLLSCRLRTLGEMLLNLTSDDVTSRVIKLLTRLSARYGKPMNRFTRLDIALTHQEMADMIGTSRQTVTSVLGELRRKGLLRIENHRMHISNDELLERFENSPYAATGN
jgi:CRP-like cAMP-binding protein